MNIVIFLPYIVQRVVAICFGNYKAQLKFWVLFESLEHCDPVDRISIGYILLPPAVIIHLKISTTQNVYPFGTKVIWLLKLWTTQGWMPQPCCQSRKFQPVGPTELNLQVTPNGGIRKPPSHLALSMIPNG